MTLSGHVESFVEKHVAEAVASRVKGVKAVADEIEVKLPFDRRRSDDEIAAAAIERLAWDAAIPRDAIKVEVDQGWVTLTGEVDWYYQKEAARQEISRLLGVVGVSDQTTIRPRVDASNVSDDIIHALHRSWFFDPKTITVAVEGGTVRLTGTVDTPHDRRLAAEAAWAAPGVTAVENKVTIA